MILSEELKQFVKKHASDNVHDIALQASRYPTIEMKLAVRQIQGRQIAKYKLPEWYQNEDILYPRHLSMEQCSSEYTAKFKASLCTGKTLTDLTGGLGIDFYYMSQQFDDSIYVERNVELATLTKHNLSTLGLANFNVIINDAETHLMQMDFTDWIYIDPARRSETGKKVFMLHDCSPDILKIEPILEKKAANTMIKLSPMLDISQSLAALKNVSDVYIVSYLNECKELLFIKKRTINNYNIDLHCININRENTDILTFRREDEDNYTIFYADSIGKYLYEPNASLLKAGAYKFTANHFGIKKLHPNSHLYTSDTLCEVFHGRSFIVDHVYSFSKNDLKAVSLLKQANISVRNLSLPVNELKKKLKLNDGGDVYIFATTQSDNKKVLIVCHKA